MYLPLNQFNHYEISIQNTAISDGGCRGYNKRVSGATENRAEAAPYLCLNED